MESLPYSYHTYLFPFIWNNGSKTSWEEFKKVLSVDKRWKSVDWEQNRIPANQNRSEWLLDYAAYQYFTEPACNALFNIRGNNIVHCFEYWNDGKPVTSDGTSRYIIKKDHNTWVLLINRIRLYVYDAGVAVLIFELENHEHTSINDVNAINEYARRVNLPFLSPGARHALCADIIELHFDNLEFSSENYLRTLQSLETNFDAEKEKISLDYIMKPIQKLLDGDGSDNSGYLVTTQLGHVEEKKLLIKPCIDDRMFVCCLIRDEELSSKFTAWNSADYQYEYLNLDSTVGIDIYKCLYIENDCSCQSKTMRQILLKESVYDRWFEYGTLYAATHHSIICVTGKAASLVNMVINPFLTQYMRLAILTIVQRSVMLSLSSEAASVSDNFQNNSGIAPSQIEEVEHLQSKYVKIQNQLLLSDATVQEQGVEIYDLLCKQLYIEKNQNVLNEQMNNLRDIADISNARIERRSDESLNRNLSWLSLAGIFFAIIQDITVITGEDVAFWPWKAIGILFAAILLALGIIIFRNTLFVKKRVKEEKFRKEEY